MKVANVDDKYFTVELFDNDGCVFYCAKAEGVASKAHTQNSTNENGTDEAWPDSKDDRPTGATSTWEWRSKLQDRD